jgi:DNA-binding transcriptional LysR family regulator
MEWQQLEYFQTVARLEHFTRASEQLSIAQSTLSRAISNLEQELGTPLFDRRGRNVFLNQYGKVFLSHVEEALQIVQTGKHRIQEMLDAASGMVSLAFFTTLGVHLVPDLIRGFNELYPNVQFQLTQSIKTPTMLEELESGQLDLIFCLPPSEQSKVEWSPLFSEELYVIVPANHPLAKFDSIRLIDIADEQFIILKKGIGLRGITDSLCAKAGFEPKIAFEGEELSMIVGLVGSGLGVSLIPSITKVDPTRTSLLRIKDPDCRRHIGIAWNRERKLSLAALKFKNFVLERVVDIKLGLTNAAQK